MASSIDKPTFGDRVKKKFKKFGIITLTSVLVVGIGTFSFLYWGVYAEGVRAGVVVSIRKQGTVFKTYEGQLSMQTFGSLKGADPLAETFDFSVEKSKPEIIKQLEDASRSGVRVNLRYVKRYSKFPWRGDTKYFVNAVEPYAGAANPGTEEGSSRLYNK